MSLNNSPKKVFISYAREDEEYAKRLSNILKEVNMDPWLDKEIILPGIDWKIAIRKGIRDSKYFIPLLSSNSVEKRGFVQKEFQQALDILEEISPSDLFVIPIRLDSVKVSNKKINSRHIEDLSQDWDQGTKRVLKSMGIDYPPDAAPLSDDSHWIDILNAIDEKNCIPIIGEGTPFNLISMNSSVSSNWAEKFNYPFEDSYQLPKVSQFLALTKNDNNYPKKLLSKYLRDIKIPNYSLEENKNTPYAVLAKLDLPIYITTNYDHCMESALKSFGKEPVSEFCRWNERIYKYAIDRGLPYAFDPVNNYEPSPAKPLVYHLHGDMDIPQSMVLTERDYFEFVINMNKIDEKETLPALIRKNLNLSKLLFVGYDFNNIYIRLVMECLLNFTDFDDVFNMAILKPIDSRDGKSKTMEQYMEIYLKNSFSLYVQWQDINDFFPELRRGWDMFKSKKYSLQ